VTSRRTLTTFYRTSEDFRRYSVEDPEARRRMQRLCRRERAYLGSSLLDVACGGGALALVYEGPGRRYIGVDTNPDMIRDARRAAAARSSSSKFLLADARRMRLEGTFDTITCLGNALGHLTVRDFDRVLGRLEGHLRPGARFILDYRDTVQLLFDREWARRYVQRKGGRRVASVTRGIDPERGEILITTRAQGARRPASISQAIWSPFIVEALMSRYGWELLRRSKEARWHGWRDVYGRPGSGHRRGSTLSA
jgi:SAM-dependent methyltransferase